MSNQESKTQKKKWRKKKSHSPFSRNRDKNLLRQYLQEYRDRMYDHYDLPTPPSVSSDDAPSRSLLDSDEVIVIFEATFPRLDDPVLLKGPFLALPSTLDGRSRRQAHSLCEELRLFHVGVQSVKSNERFVAISIFHDGLSRVPGIDSDPVAQKKSETFLPWIKRKDVDAEQETRVGTERIYELIDQPGKCLRDGSDQIDLIELENADLSTTTPPRHEDNNWIWIKSVETLQQCVRDLQSNKPKELAFDLECLSKSKMHQLTCLIQLATDDGREYIIDVLADGVWEGVGRGLAPLFSDRSIVKVGHGVMGVDVPSLHRDFGIYIVNLFDTLEAARVLNIKAKGLANLCAHYNLPNCDTYSALKDAYQMADWTRRPLTEPMILYGRYDVHYLLQLRRLMMRDLVKLSLIPSSTVELGNESEAMRDMIRALNEEDGFKDDDFDLGRLPADDGDKKEDALTSLVDENKTLFLAKDLRMNLDLMQVISSSQDKCLSLWNEKAENHWKNADYLEMMKQNKKSGREWSLSQKRLYDRLAEWRDSVASENGILQGFVCETDFLAKMVQYRPTSKLGVQQICYFLSCALKEKLEEMLQLSRQSRDEDGLPPELQFPSYEESVKMRASQNLPDSSNCVGIWTSYLALGIAITASAIFLTTRRSCTGSVDRKPRSTNFCWMTHRKSSWMLILSIFSNGVIGSDGLTMDLRGDSAKEITRRDFGGTAFHTAILGSGSAFASPAHAGSTSRSLAEKLSQKDPALLANSVFNLPPPAQVYPSFMRGTWNVTLQYGGYLFPSQKIPRARLTADAQIPGFQKCSIAALSDVGKDVVQYNYVIDRETGLEDRSTTLTTSIDAHLGYPAVQQVLYNPKANPNRLSIVFVEYRTTNAERIELFCNGRESELVQRTEENGDTRQIFVCSEYIRQVTFGTGSEVGIPRQVGTNYAHFWTWKETPNDPNLLTGNLLTAGYLDPQDALFFEEPSKPVTVYSHIMTAKRIS